MTPKDFTDAWVKMRKFTDNIPDEVVDFMRDSAIEKWEELQTKKPENSTHSFTEGADVPESKESFKTYLKDKPTIDDMIVTLKNAIGTMNHVQVITHKEDEVLTAAVQTLTKIKSFAINQNLGIDLEKVLEDLIAGYGNSPNYLTYLGNAKSALVMIRAFKTKGQVMTHLSSSSREDVIKRIATYHIAQEGKGPVALARTIVYAIEDMEKLKANGTN